MPTPVSCFSPFTPFTPASSAHGSAGYFDSQSPSIRNAVSPFSRRPDLCSHNYSSGSSSRISRLAAPIDSPRQRAENGWRMALRLREEALSAWEQHVRSNINMTNITTLRPPRQSFNKLAEPHTQRITENSTHKPRSTSSDRAQQISQASRPSLRLSLHIKQALRKTHSEGLIDQAPLTKLVNTSRPSDHPSGSTNSAQHAENLWRF